MNEREADFQHRLEELSRLTAGPGADAAALFEWAASAKRALDFSEPEADAAAGTVNDQWITKLDSARLRALRLAGEAGHELAAIEYATTVWRMRDPELAAAAAGLAAKHAASPECAHLLGLFAGEGFGAPKNARAALSWLRQAADAGNAAAMFELYGMLSQGSGGALDMSEALRWCQASAEAGELRAMAELGALYADGEDVAQDETRSLRWYDAAARAGHAKSATTLGIRYGLGQGAPRSTEHAKEYFALAQQRGFNWRPLAKASGLDPDAYEA